MKIDFSFLKNGVNVTPHKVNKSRSNNCEEIK